MTDKLSPRDEDIIRRLRSFKNAGSDYPADLLGKRRASFRNAAMGLTLPLPAAGFVKRLMRYLLHTTNAALKVILVSALVVMAGLGVYLYRDQIRDQIMNWLASDTVTPTVTLSSHAPLSTLSGTATPTPIPTAAATPTTAHMATTTPTPTPTATGTIFTVEPTQTPRPTDPGHHYGQTKTPKP